ncbi:DNA-binding response regulator [Dokdonia sinensis]|uniref:DNA-binding response regulator n=1 Tax=Dokdonia sinensis TaxID=2479847 RepID=A0A3M0G218_9FLAO|nr:response regulator [Dokdonia sinensis]RMB56222.1 DNA-binding response regulator [Dokdonia sinensis]
MSHKILLIEDEFIIARDIEMELGKNGFARVLRCSTPAEAKMDYKENEFDLILSDINLEAEIDGIELVAQLQEIRKTPAVFLTAFSNPEIVARAEKIMPFAYVLKPFHAEQLKITINLALSNFEKRQNEAGSEETQEKLTLLTQREVEILSAFSSGKTSKEVGDELHISHQTVEKHKKNIKKKLDMSTIGELIRFAVDANLIK